ncbi:glycosyltransferase family 25 protein [Roseovarius sp. 2305UL8-3]|uniref:glycosyltransferase family 25 protein n=1 Tax=Roseovarius conchicola TaxID=3121636 RepID=UPI003526DC7A
MEVHAFVLHLTRASGRKANAHHLRDTFKAIDGFDKVEIWPAVDGSALSSGDLSDIVGADLFHPSYPFPLNNGEIGCFLSHRQIWAEMQMREANAALIIEDDAGIDLDHFTPALELAAQNIARLGYIQLQTRRTVSPAALIDSNGPCHLSVPRVAGLRTTAQMVSKEAAAHLLQLSEMIDRPVDTFVQSHWHTGLRPAMILPSGVNDVAADLDGSTIQKGGRSTFENLARTIYRARYRRGVNTLSRRSAAPAKGGLANGR